MPKFPEREHLQSFFQSVRTKWENRGSIAESETEPFLLSDIMSVRLGEYDRTGKRFLPDGTRIHFRQPMGKLDIDPLPSVPNETPFKRANKLYLHGKIGLTRLASLCQTEAAFQNIQIFGGYSNIVENWMQKLGFNISEVDAEFEEYYRDISLYIQSRASGIVRHHVRVREALISRNKLIELYGNPQLKSENVIFQANDTEVSI